MNKAVEIVSLTFVADHAHKNVWVFVAVGISCLALATVVALLGLWWRNYSRRKNCTWKKY